MDIFEDPIKAVCAVCALTIILHHAGGDLPFAYIAAVIAVMFNLSIYVPGWHHPREEEVIMLTTAWLGGS